MHISETIHFEYSRHERQQQQHQKIIIIKKASQPATDNKLSQKKMVAFDFGARCFASIYAYFEPIARHRIRDID